MVCTVRPFKQISSSYGDCFKKGKAATVVELTQFLSYTDSSEEHEKLCTPMRSASMSANFHSLADFKQSF